MASTHSLKKKVLVSPRIKAIQVSVAKQPTEGTVTFEKVKGGGKSNAGDLSTKEDRPTEFPWGRLVIMSEPLGVKNTDNVQRVRIGFKHTELEGLAKTLGVSQEQVIALLKLPRSTIKRQQSEGRLFSAEHSDRMYRALKLIDVSTDTLGDHDEAVRWLQREHPSLGGVTAMSLVDTTAGYERVLDELERIAHGVPV